ncbi:MAG: DHH family phosphoesterase [Planctomycetota bacterium]|jgi:nanoRNase/pAp phosphatase (c-di-AMP/oligoRNAs hydrolase)
MKCLVVSEGRPFYAVLARSVPAGVEAHYWLEKGERTPYQDMENVFRGEPWSPETYSAYAEDKEHVAIVFYRPKADAIRIGKAIEKALPKTKVLFLGVDEDVPETESLDGQRVTVWEDLVRMPLGEEVRKLVSGWRVERLTSIFEAAKNVGILIQHDPDPDALASALALRKLLNRNRLSAPILSFGKRIVRPENRAMCELLDLHVEWITAEDLPRFETLACVDIQPAVFANLLGERSVEAVIDHHPEQTGYRCSYRDIRNSYGATATIMAEYLLAAGIEINQRMATALLYGIKSDTLFLDRNCTRADLNAFHHLFSLANLNTIRRMEKPEIPQDVLKTFGKALTNLDLGDGLSFAFLGEVREDVIAQMAELLLQVEGAQWSVACGIVEDALVGSVRNAGYQRAAGDMVKRTFGAIGSAGGHRTMAKFIVPLDAFHQHYGQPDAKGLRCVMREAIKEVGTNGDGSGSA